ncbi:MAG: Fur family transcriptional regulator [Eubacteriales bacterium]|nr:Fur family transcriptional regulator [Eubacteriales bacterium]
MTDDLLYEQRLKTCGLKNTRQRKSILDIMLAGNQPFTVEEIYLQLKAKAIDISMSTVYRSLETMSQKGVLQRVTLSGDNRMAYVIDRAAHSHYLVCSGCKKILPISQCPLGAYEKALEDETGFEIQGHRLDIYGLCPDCQKTRSRKKG